MSDFYIQDVGRIPTVSAAETPYYNAAQLQGISITTSSVTANSTIIYNSVTDEWEYTTSGLGITGATGPTGQTGATGTVITSYSTTGMNLVVDSAQSTGFAHGLGGVPNIIQPRMVCKATGDGNYAIGDEVHLATSEPSASFSFVADSTSVYFSHPAQAIGITDKTTDTNVTITNNRWDVIINAYKF